MPFNLRFLRYLLPLLFISFSNFLTAQERYTVSGTVRDKSTGETLIGATVTLKDSATSINTSTNSYGFFSLTVKPSQYDVFISYVGYQTSQQKISLNKSTALRIELASSSELKEVVISAKNRPGENIRSPQMGLDKLDMKTISSVPVLFGEKDILKTIQLLPGVKSGGEGNTGFFVRGGAADQNLILLDEATVYNSSHLLGFFSTFNSDAIKDVNLYKGGMPAQYGGRLSSVLDVKMDDGNSKNFSVQGGIGLIASRLKVEGPIVKNKSSFMISGRRTYLDLLLKASPDPDLKGNTLNFYDLNAKFNYRFDDKNTVYLSGYFGQDNLGIKNLFDNDWGNSTATLRYNHLFNDRLFSNTSVIYNKYNYNIRVFSTNNNFTAKSLIRDYNLKEDLQYYGNKHILRFGVNALHHRLQPSDIETTGQSSVNSQSIEYRYGLEGAAYVSDEWQITNWLNVLYGTRFSSFTVLGPGTFKTYDGSGFPVSTQTYDDHEFGKSYFYLEPRVSASFSMNDQNSIKLSYNRNTQNIHILSNSGSSTPTDQYVLSSNNIKPELADQVSAGYFKNLAGNAWEFSVETYYKWLQNQIDYRDGAQLIANADVESQLLYGKGRSYGLELYAKKNAGKLVGWISYTLARTERKFDKINNGNYFPARYDRLHDLSVTGVYNLSKRWNFAGSFIYSTGNAVTYPAGKYEIGGMTTYYYTSRNANRMPYTSRLDLSATLEGKENKKFHSSWSFGVYNALNRKNPYSISFRDSETKPGTTEAVQVALFGIIPSVTWNFKF
ncbi:TonB-dependent receptor plug domain-containing protein [Pedobacter sp. HMF7647]|uniref:TonB-dependent receptor plug domain-containing protein n=1 Tax=Hufsiella arboris TaxID=2695275 RepID=A0A7K1Y9S3_9SPHI|nr:TonB-dependent receptor [Hufsiella arboris]MXV50808.1 TonB-dependent receptor plug domain-containing protein [Hufsiella arboris]